MAAIDKKSNHSVFPLNMKADETTIRMLARVLNRCNLFWRNSMFSVGRVRWQTKIPAAPTAKR